MNQNTRQTPPWSRLPLRIAILIFGLSCLAPTPGDIGGCGQEAQELDWEEFFSLKRSIDCERCADCDLETRVCTRACEADGGVAHLPEECVPLVHDGEVCLRSLIHASCSDYRAFMDDTAPAVPSECNFCPPRGR